MRRFSRIGAAIALVATGVLAYGYWFAQTHGALYVHVVDVADRKSTRPLLPLDLSFVDAEGRVLAEASAAAPYGTIQLSSPSLYSCREIEARATIDLAAREEWSACFERQSQWVPTWIEDAATVNLRLESCTIERVPLSLSKYSDWWLWWVPLPHVGGKPYTLFSVRIEFDRGRCRPSAA